MKESKKKSFSFFPPQRLSPDFSWSVWAVGWLVIFKAVTWLATDPNVPDAQLSLLGIKYLIFMIPFLVFGFFLWNLKKWAVWAVLLLCVGELIFFVKFYPVSLNTLSLDKTSLLSLLLSLIIFIINGPLSDIIILISSPFLFKHTGKK